MLKSQPLINSRVTEVTATTTTECIVSEFLYADDAAICTTLADKLQELLDGLPLLARNLV